MAQMTVAVALGSETPDHWSHHYADTLAAGRDGKTVYACTARLQPREMTLAPLSNKKLVRDLVTEIAPPMERFTDS